MTYLSEAQLDTLKEMLNEEKNELEQHFRRNGGRGKSESLTEASGELSSSDNHPADLATETFDRDKDIAIDHSIDNRLDEINEALKRMEAGTYGLCTVDGDRIPYGRLEAIPSTPTCVEHAPEAAFQSDRPIEEEVMTPPPSGAGVNRQRNAGRFDDAQAWELAQSHGNPDVSDVPGEKQIRGIENR